MMLPILMLILVIVVYFYLKLKYFTRYGPIPGLSPEFFFGNMRQTGMLTRNESIPNVNLDFQRKYGDIYQFWMGPTRLITVCNADDVEHILTHRNIYDQGDIHIHKFRLLFHDALICNKGVKYKRHASVIMPLFRRNKIIHNTDLIVDCTDQILLDQWKNFDENFIHTNIVDQCQKLLLTIFGFIGFDYDFQNINNPF